MAAAAMALHVTPKPLLPSTPLHKSTASRSSLPLSLPLLGGWALSRPTARVVCAATKEGKEQQQQDTKPNDATNNDVDADSVTRKFGLEAGLWKILSSKDDEEGEAGGKKTNQAKELLKRYGGAYLATSISLSLVSFALCYALVQAGVDVPIVLEKVGLHVNETGEKVGTFALAYAAHKALSPVRFPPTVALTPIVAAWFGKKADNNEDSK